MTKEEIVWNLGVAILEYAGCGTIRYDQYSDEHIWVDYSTSPFNCRVWCGRF